MAALNEERIWKEKANSEYQKVVSLFIGMSSAALILPSLILRELLGVPSNEALVLHLDGAAYLGWGLLLLSILAGAAYHYASAKWLKSVFGGPVNCSSAFLEKTLDWLFWACIATFIFGAISITWFFVNHLPNN